MYWRVLAQVLLLLHLLLLNFLLLQLLFLKGLLIRLLILQFLTTNSPSPPPVPEEGERRGLSRAAST